MAKQEREMTRLQRDLVDTCFEENHYEYAIEVLDQLRSEHHRPSASHIRQLLYIALYPPPPAGAKGKEKANLDPVSPSKLSRQPGLFVAPPPAATVAARRLLVSFAHTNSPGALFRAFPSYASASGQASVGDDDEDSSIAQESACIKEAPFCWNILREGFIRRKGLVSAATRGKRRRTRDAWDDDDLNGDSGHGIPAVVGEDAWAALDWMLLVFEKDELLTGTDRQDRHSPILASQLSSPVAGSRTRWKLDAPLDIVFYCLQQDDPSHKSMGVRLLTLLINLSSTALLDRAIFIASSFTRLSTSAPEAFTSLFAALPLSAAVFSFKVSLCQKYIIDTALGHDPAQPGPRPKPQARRGGRGARSSRTTEECAEPSPASPPATRHFAPPSSEILRLMELNLDTDTSAAGGAAPLRIKFELVAAYTLLQGQIGVHDQDSGWAKLRGDARFKQALSRSFGASGVGRVYRDTLEAVIA